MLDLFRQKIGKLFADYEEIATISVAMAIGFATGLGNIVFRSLIEFFQHLFFNIDSEIMLYLLLNHLMLERVLFSTLQFLEVSITLFLNLY